MTRPDLPADVIALIERTGHRRYFALTDASHRDYNPRVLPVLVARARGLPMPGGARPVRPARPADPSTPSNPHMARLDLVRACPQRRPMPGCGCSGGATCLAGKGSPRDGFVSIAECLACVQSPPLAAEDPTGDTRTRD